MIIQKNKFLKHKIMKGRVKWFDTTKGFGFIHTEEGNDIFVHYSGFVQDDDEILEEGESVEFEIAEGRRGPHAIAVKKVDE